MPVEINEFKLPMTPADACAYVQSATDSLGIFVDMDRCNELIAILSLQNRDIEKECRELSNNKVLNIRDKMSIISALMEHGAALSDFQVNYKKPNNVYLNRDSRSNLLNNPSFNATGRMLLDRYQRYTTNNYNISILKSFIVFDRSKLLSFDGHRMVKINPTWNLLNTSRIGSSKPNIQGLSRDLCDIFTYPKGYVLVHADSSQIEPRINFSHFVRDELIVKLITYYGDAYYGLLHYCTATDDEIKNLVFDFESNFVPIEITDDIVDRRQTIKTLTNAGSYGSSNLLKVDRSLASAFEKRIKNHPARLELERKVEDAVNRGVCTFYGAFGTPVTPEDKDSYIVGTKAHKQHMIRCGINNPVQTTASELMICGMDVARKLLAEAKDSYLMWYKHDDAGFLVSEEDAANGYIDKLGEVTAYNVRGWIPIGSEKLVGKKKPVYESYL